MQSTGVVVFACTAMAAETPPVGESEEGLSLAEELKIEHI